MNRLFVMALLLPLVPATLNAQSAAPQENGAALLANGDRFPDLNARDQHDAEYRLEPGTGAVLIAFDMATGKRANQILAEKGAEFLDEHRAVYVSNIYGMPAIGRYFAFSKMRKYPHRIVLADAEHQLDAFPRKEGYVTVVRLNDAAVIQSIDFWNPEEDAIQKHLN